VLKKKYIRDKRSPVPKNENVSRVMSANKAKHTAPEMTLRKALWKNGIKRFRLHSKNIIGKPDISFKQKKVAVFIHGCFWHRCPYCRLSDPKNNSRFWKAKFEANKGRDKKKVRQLRKQDWKVVTIWECQIKKNITNQIKKVRKVYEANSN